MNLILFIAGEVLFLGLIISLIGFSGPLNIFFDVPSLIITLGVGFALTIISFSIHDIKSALHHAFGLDGTKDELRKSAYIWEATARNLLLAGTIGLIIGIIQMLQNLNDPATIGPSIAVALLTMFYGFFFSAALPFPAMFMIKKRIETE
jgi:flagellar motor component MotA